MSEIIFQYRYSLALLLVLLCVVVFLFLQEPSHDKDWLTAQQKIPSIDYSSSAFTITNIRDFEYSTAGDIIQQRYISQSYNFNDLKNIWFGLSHFGGHGLAHAFLSFEFESHRFLALSVEARLESDESYSPIKGLFRQYEKIYVFATEHDVIGLRSHSRNERVLLFPLQIDHEMAVGLLQYYLQQAKAIETSPAFYNTILDNCLTSILRGSDYFSAKDFVTNPDIIFPGRSDKLAYQLQLLNNKENLDVLRAKAQIDSLRTQLNDPDFSLKIREKWMSAL